MSDRPCFCRWLRHLMLVLALALPAWGDSYLSRVWQTGDGMPSNSVTGVTMDDQGYLWIGTGAGVARFDGMRFETFSVKDGLPDSQILCLRKDRRGRIWAGTRRGPAFRENGAWHRVEGAPEVSIFSLGEAPDGSIWFGAYAGCWRWSGGTVAQVELTGIAADTRGFLDDGFGGMWILTRSHLCRWYPSDPGLAAPVPGPWSGYDLYGLCRDSRGRRVIVGTGLMLRESDEGWEDLAEGLPDGRAAANLACEGGSDGKLWIATRDRGVMMLGSDGWAGFDSTSGLSLDDVRRVFLDAAGRVWLGTNGGGLNLLVRRPFASYAAAEGLGRTVTSALVIDRDGRVWAGTDGRGILRLEQGGFVPAFPAGEFPELGLIWSMAAARDGSLWAGTYRDGLKRIRGGGVESIPLPESARDREITALHEMRDGRLLIGVAGCGVYCWRDGGVEPVFGEIPGPDLRIHDVLEDRGGVLWMACGSQGLWRGDGGTWTRVGDAEQALNPVCLLESSGGGLWVGSLGQGLLFHQDGKWRRWNRDQGLVSDTVVQLLEDARGDLWVGSDSGLQRLSRGELEAGGRLNGVRIGRGEGLPTPQFSGEHGNLCAAAGDGTLWFSLASGAIHLDPTDFAGPQEPPAVRVVSVETDDAMLWRRRGVQGPEEVRVPAGSGTLRIRFAAPEYTAPERLRFRCRMGGLEKEWQEIDASRVVSYASLPPGSFGFELQVAGGDGRWSPLGAGFQVVQRPHFWQRLDFRIVSAVLAATALGLAVSRWSRRRLRRKVEALRQERRVELERARIARDLHDDLGASLSEINFLGTLAGAKLAPGPARDKVTGMVERAQRMAKSLDEIVWTVNPQHDTLSSTVHYLCSRVRESLRAAELRCRLEVGGDLPECSLDSQLRHHLLMSVNEAVHNVMKHAAATEVVFSLHGDGGRLRVVIADNGRGFDPETGAGDRNGLRNLRRRMEAAGGSFRISSTLGGTTVTLELPLPK